MPPYHLTEIAGWIITIVLTVFLVQAFVIWLISLLLPYPKRPENPHLHHFTCVITAYKNIIMCNPLVESLLRNDYPRLNIVIIADECEISDFHMYENNVKVVKPPHNLGSKVRSMQYALDYLTSETEGIIVMDPDNLVHPDFLFHLNNYFHRGFDVVQGIRIAKNKNSSFARSDSLGEFYYNFTDRYVAFKAGSSATISGSGMAIQKDLYREFLLSDKVQRKLLKGPILGEDKMLQNYTVLKGGRVAFEPEAIVFDEKLVSGKQVERQRTRWINTYFENLGDAIRMLFYGIIKFRWNSLIIGLISVKPPLFILAGSALIAAAITFFIDYRMTLVLLSGLVIFGLFFIFAAWKSPHSKNVIKAVWGVPQFIYFQIRALLKTRKHRKDFLATDNSQNVSIDEMVGQDNK